MAEEEGFEPPVEFPPQRFNKSFSPNPATPPSGGSTSSILTISLEPSVTAGTYTITETGTSGSLTHSTSVTVNVKFTIAGIGSVINKDVRLGAIDNSGIGTALLSKLAVAQAASDSGQIQVEINTLQATLFQLQAQAGKHIKTTWVDGTGQSFNPDGVLVGDVNSLLAGLGANFKGDPIIGYVVNGSGLGLSGLTVNILNSKNVAVASATTDVTGSYYFPATTGLTLGANYSVKVTVPKAYRNSSPSLQSFTWKAVGLAVNTFVLN